MFPTHAARCRGNAPTSQKTSPRAVCLALQVFTCLGSLPGFTACLQRHMQSCSNSSNLCRRVGAPCFPKSHRAATGKDQSSRFVESHQLIRLHVNFIPALDLNTPAATSTDNQSTGNQASAGADLLCCLLKNFIPHSQKDKGQVLWV